MRRILARTGILLVSTLLSLILIEGLLRFFKIVPPIFKVSAGEARLSYNPILGYELVPGFGDINKDGFRSPMVSLEKSVGVRRLAMLGDSVAFGYGGIPVTETMSVQLVKQLNTKSNLKFEIINAGVGGYNTLQEAELFRTKVKKFQPEIIFLELTIANDYLPKTFDYDAMILREEAKNRLVTYNFFDLAAKSNRSLYSSYAYRYLVYIKAFIKSRIENNKKINRLDLVDLPSYKKEDWDRAFNTLLNEKIKKNPWEKSTIIQDGFKLLKESLDYPARVIVVVVPEFKNLLETNQETLNKHKDVARWAKENSFEVIDLLPCYQEYLKNNSEKVDSGDAIHPNVLGHKIAALCIENYLNKNIENY